jgi:PilZ domain
MTGEAERRIARRYMMMLPVRVLAGGAQHHELRTLTRNVSYQGLYFVADVKFEVGGEFEFVLTLPQPISKTGDVDILCRGQVVRVESGSNGRVGIAAKIQRYEFVPAAANAA